MLPTNEIRIPLRLADVLGGMTKDELSSIRSVLNISGISTLNKQALASELERRIPEAAALLLPTFDEHRLNLVKKIVQKGGYIASPNLYSIQEYYFLERCMMFAGNVNGKRCLVMPQEVVDKLRTLDFSAYTEEAKRNTEWIRVTYGMLYYYGTLTVEELGQMLPRYFDGKLPFRSYMDVLLDSLDYYEDALRDHVGFSNILVTDPDQVKAEHDMRAAVKFCPFTKEQLMKAGQPEYVERNPAYLAAVDFFVKQFGMTRTEADHLVEECVFEFHGGALPSHLIETPIQREIELKTEKDVYVIVDKLTDLYHHTKQWDLKGYSPNEFGKAIGKPQNPAKQPAVPSSVLAFPPAAPKLADVISIGTKQKIGRNDPCPCGSGKKFKKCCGTAE